MNNFFDNSGFFRWLWKHKIAILVAQVISAAVSIGLTTYYITPEYESYAVVYPFNLKSYSEETSTEQLLQFLSSVDIKNEVIKDFKLISHYKIDTNYKYWYSKLLEKYDWNVEVSSTEYEAVKIAVLDKNPDTASLIVNDIIRVLNQKILATQREKSEEEVKLLKTQMDKKKKEMDSLSGISKILSVQYGLLDYPNQTKEVEKAYYGMLSSNKAGKPMDETTEQIKNLEEKGDQFKQVNRHLQDEIGNYDDVLDKYQTAVSEANKQLTFTNLVAKPYPSDEKAYPVLWLVLLIDAILMFICSVILLRLIERLGHKRAKVSS